MPRPYQPILSESRRPCLLGNGRPVIAGISGQAPCVCEPQTPCPFYYRAHACNDGDCTIPNDYLYFCGDVPCLGGGVYNGATVYVPGATSLCYNADTTVKYVPQNPPPPGFASLPPNARVESYVGCHPYSCSECPVLNDGYWLLAFCGCQTSPGTGSATFWASCACLRAAHQLYDCPIFQYTHTNGQGQSIVLCTRRNLGLPPVTELPSGGVAISCNYMQSCCECCESCCACPSCLLTTVTYPSATVHTDPWPCCRGRLYSGLVGSGTYTQRYDGTPHIFERRFLRWFGEYAIETVETFDPNTGEPTGTFSAQYNKPPECAWAYDYYLGALLSPVGTTNGVLKIACDFVDAEFRTANNPGGIFVTSTASFRLTGSRSNCEGPCEQGGGFGGRLLYGASYGPPEDMVMGAASKSSVRGHSFGCGTCRNQGLVLPTPEDIAKVAKSRSPR